LIPLLDALGGLPPGLVSGDLLPTARIVSGELTAAVTWPLLAWSASGASSLTARSPIWKLQPGNADGPNGRVRLQLGTLLRWTLEARDGAGWRALETKW